MRKLLGLILLVLPATALGADWPMARYDSGRRAASPQKLADQLHLQWTRQYPVLTPAWPDQPKMQFDQAYDPIVVGQRMFLASSKHDWVAALDTRGGKELWRFFAEGPVRFAPLAWKDRLYFASDDGHLYCLDAAKGDLLWKHRGGPSDRKILGNERLVSTWPARGAPVIEDGTLYYAASIWPFMGIFIHALDAQTGKSIWINDGEGTNYIKQPHNTDSFATVAPQGHLAIVGDRLVIPGGRSIPGIFDRLTGKLLQYKLAESGKRGGGSEVTVAGSYFFNGGSAFTLDSQKYLADVGKPVAISGTHLVAQSSKSVNVYDFKKPVGPMETETIDRKGKLAQTSKWALPLVATGKAPALEDLILAGGRIYGAAKGQVLALDFDEETEEVETVWQADIDGTPMRLVAADDRLFVVTREGQVHCFGADAVKAVRHEAAAISQDRPSDEWTDKAALILKETEAEGGYAIILKIGSGRLIQELHSQSKLTLLVIEPDPKKVRALRDGIVAADLDRVSVFTGDVKDFPLPPYLASLIVGEGTVEDLSPDVLRSWFQWLRPYGGTLVLPDTKSLSLATRDTKLEGAVLTEEDGFQFIKRAGALAGSANWTHEHADSSNTRVSKDLLVKAPLGVLWFGGPPNDDILPRHGHGPQPQVVDGRLIIEGVDLMRAIDIYTGRLLWETPLPGVGRFYNNTAHQPGANASGSNYVSTPEGIYVAWNDCCVKLDVETGKIESKFQLPPLDGAKEAPLWAYINVQGDYLIGGAEPIFDPKNLPAILKPRLPDEDDDAKKPAAKGDDKKPAGKDDDKKSFEKQDVADPITKLIRSIKAFNDNMSGSRRLIVMDRHTGKVLWSVQGQCWFRHNATTIGAGKLFTIDRLSGEQLAKYKRIGEDPPFPSRLRVFDLKSGKELWSAAEDVFGTWLSYSAKHGILLEAGRVGRDTLLDEPKGIRAYNAATGEVLWYQKGYSGPAMIRGDEILQGQGACSITTGDLKMREDPITGLPSAWSWIRNYGCNTPAASEHLMTFRSGAAGFFDLCNDGGTGNLGGFRSSCTNNLIASGGVLAIPDYTRTCTCAYQNQSSIGLIHMPEAEMWTVFGTKDVKGPIRRLGLNFGAPGDRRSETGTLWLEYPSAAGASPAIEIKTRPEKLEIFRRHSSSIEGEASWVCSSGIRGIEQLTLTLDKFAFQPRKYTVRLFFSEPENLQLGQRTFKVELQDKTVIEKLDVVKEAGGSMRSLVREFKGIMAQDELFLRLTPTPDSFVPTAILNGLEIIAEE